MWHGSHLALLRAIRTPPLPKTFFYPIVGALAGLTLLSLVAAGILGTRYHRQYRPPQKLSTPSHNEREGFKSPREPQENLGNRTESTFPPPLTFLPQNDPGRQNPKLEKKIVKAIKKDDAEALEKLINEHPDLPDFALRSSSKGYPDCFCMLLEKGANPMSAEPKSGKIALHYAIEHFFLDGITLLLSQENSKGLCNPSEQLLFGQEPFRPIYCIAKLDNVLECQQVIGRISQIMRDPVGQGEHISTDQRKEVETILARETARWKDNLHRQGERGGNGAVSFEISAVHRVK